MQFCMSRDVELTHEKIREFIQYFELNDRVKLNKYNRYYDGNQDIINKVRTDEYKPCNKIVTNYCLNIVNNYQGYLAGQDINYSSQDDITEIQNVLNYNDVSCEDSEFLRNALIYGRAFEINYVDEDGQSRFKTVDSKECIPIYDDTLENNLLYMIRYYPIEEYNKISEYRVEVYDAEKVSIYKSTYPIGTFTLMHEIPHYYGQVPVVVFSLNKDEKSIFDSIMSLQDAYNNLLSDEVDDFQAFCDAYLVLKGCTADEDDIKTMKQNRVLLLESDAEAAYLNKSISDTQIENMLKNINDNIHKIANSPDFSQESFGTSSGIALRFRLLGFENTAGAIVKNMTKALQKRIELICNILNLTSGENNAIWRDIEIIFTRNIPVDNASAASMVNTLRGLVSDQTLLTQLPFISDPAKEMELLDMQHQKNAEMYGFTNVNIPSNEEEEV